MRILTRHHVFSSYKAFPGETDIFMGSVSNCVQIGINLQGVKLFIEALNSFRSLSLNIILYMNSIYCSIYNSIYCSIWNILYMKLQYMKYTAIAVTKTVLSWRRLGGNNPWLAEVKMILGTVICQFSLCYSWGNWGQKGHETLSRACH